MDSPLFSDSEFLDQNVLNAAFGLGYLSAQQITDLTNSPGLINPASTLVITPSGLNITVAAPAPFAVLFGNGALAQAFGNTNGATSSSYTVNLSSLVPGSGSVTVYVVASYSQVLQSPYEVVGPPAGHPDYNPAFAPYTAYADTRDTLTVTATTTPPDNLTTFELCRTTLVVGQSSITVISTANWHYASSLLNPTGVTGGSYPGATVTVGTDGRITGISTVAYGPLAAANTWTATNTFTNSIVLNNATWLQGKDSGGTPRNVLMYGADNFVHLIGGTAGTTIQNAALTANNVLIDDSGNVTIRNTLNVGGSITIPNGVAIISKDSSGTVHNMLFYGTDNTVRIVGGQNGFLVNNNALTQNNFSVDDSGNGAFRGTAQALPGTATNHLPTLSQFALSGFSANAGSGNSSTGVSFTPTTNGFIVLNGNCAQTNGAFLTPNPFFTISGVTSIGSAGNFTAGASGNIGVFTGLFRVTKGVAASISISMTGTGDGGSNISFTYFLIPTS